MDTDYEDIIRSLLPNYLAKRKDELQVLERALDLSDYATLSRIGHQMKGHGPSYGFPHLGKIGIALEHAGMDRDAKQASQAIIEFRGFLEQPTVPALSVDS